MRKGLIIMADSNLQGIGNKMILPIVKYVYVKAKDKYQIINMYREGFDPMISPDIKNDTLTRSYMHALKSSNEIHIIVNSHLGGLSPAFEGFLERIVRSDFAYVRKGARRSSRLKSKDVYFYVVNSTKRWKYDLNWFRLHYIVGKLFKSSTVIKINPEDVLSAGTKDYKVSINNKLRKRLNKNRS